MVKFGLNQLDNGWTNKIKCLGFGNWGKHDIFFSQPRERQRELLRLFFLVFFDSSFSSSIPLSRDRFFFLFFVLLRFSFDSFDSPSTSEAIYGQKQAFVVVGRVITGIEAKLKLRYGYGVVLINIDEAGTLLVTNFRILFLSEGTRKVIPLGTIPLATIEKGFNLAASHVVHTVGPVYNAEKNPKKLLENAYRNSLRVAKENNIQYIAFTAISCGIFRYPLDEAASIAISTVKEFGKDFKEMNADTLNLNDDDYLSVEDMMAENEDEQNAQADSVTSAAQARGDSEDENEENEGEYEEEEQEQEDGGRKKKKVVTK
ncbi:hypothetical protein HID58_002279 [Brassica napus]|uniref:Macro domain-containing protein n=1 Tax=Brassica napus TaxID=3708 RepID=A0ABQ8ELT6_BRANA|nr:hypothetical protein HID58_002279 [Brassica napus]